MQIGGIASIDADIFRIDDLGLFHELAFGDRKAVVPGHAGMRESERAKEQNPSFQSHTFSDGMKAIY